MFVIFGIFLWAAGLSFRRIRCVFYYDCPLSRYRLFSTPFYVHVGDIKRQLKGILHTGTCPVAFHHVLPRRVTVGHLLPACLHTMRRGTASSQGQGPGQERESREGETRDTTTWPISTSLTVQHESLLAGRNSHGTCFTKEISEQELESTGFNERGRRDGRRRNQCT